MKNSLITSLTNITTTEEYTPERIKNLMSDLTLNEKSLAIIMNVSYRTIKLWIAGAIKPCNTSQRLMQIIEIYPDIVATLVNSNKTVENLEVDNEF